MIRAVTDREALEAALSKAPNDIFSGKLRSLANAYGFSYDFARFYASDSGAAIADFYGDAVIAGGADAETADFCRMAGFNEVLMPEGAYFPAFEKFPAERGNIMRFEGEYEPLPAEVRINPPYDEFLELIKDAFGRDFPGWYVDTCHRVRHGVSALYMWDGASAECAFAENGTAYLTLIAVQRDKRGKGLGKRLVRAVSAHYARDSEVYLICGDSLTGFYEKAGYKRAGSCYTVNFKENKRGS